MTKCFPFSGCLNSTPPPRSSSTLKCSMYHFLSVKIPAVSPVKLMMILILNREEEAKGCCPLSLSLPRTHILSFLSFFSRPQVQKADNNNRIILSPSSPLSLVPLSPKHIKISPRVFQNCVILPLLSFNKMHFL